VIPAYPLFGHASEPLRIVEIVTVAQSAEQFLSGRLRFLKSCGYDVTVITSPGVELDRTVAMTGVRAIPVEMPREISPWGDLKAIANLARVLWKLRPHVVNAGTPKAGLLGLIAARLVRIPCRVYTLHGLRLETVTGWKRRLLNFTERLAVSCCHAVIPVSPSLGDKFVSLGLARSKKVWKRVNSSHGVDSLRYAPNPHSARVVKLRQEYRLRDDDLVIGFVGRLTRDKGIAELTEAFQRIMPRVPQAKLLLVGGFESGDPVSPEIRRFLETHPRVILAGVVPDAAPYYNLMSVLAFPSYREGLPNAPMEAAATEVPTVGAMATGTIDAIVDGVTGWLVPIADVEALTKRLLEYLQDSALRRRHGVAARERAVQEYCPAKIHEQYERMYREILIRRRVLPRDALLTLTPPEMDVLTLPQEPPESQAKAA
jgi:glycosyltransferase involved in cell wall biosynthesis